MGSKQGNHAPYDDDELVEDIARGAMTQEQIGAKHGLSQVMVGQIARGERRPELQERINAAVEGHREAARRLGAQLGRTAMARLGRLIGKTPEDEAPVDADTQRKAAVDILKFAVGDPSKPETNINNQGPPADYAEFLAWRAKNREGPE